MGSEELLLTLVKRLLTRPSFEMAVQQLSDKLSFLMRMTTIPSLGKFDSWPVCITATLWRFMAFPLDPSGISRYYCLLISISCNTNTCSSIMHQDQNEILSLEAYYIVTFRFLVFENMERGSLKEHLSGNFAANVFDRLYVLFFVN